MAQPQLCNGLLHNDPASDVTSLGDKHFQWRKF